MLFTVHLVQQAQGFALISSPEGAVTWPWGILPQRLISVARCKLHHRLYLWVRNNIWLLILLVSKFLKYSFIFLQAVFYSYQTCRVKSNGFGDHFSSNTDSVSGETQTTPKQAGEGSRGSWSGLGWTLQPLQPWHPTAGSGNSSLGMLCCLTYIFTSFSLSGL